MTLRLAELLVANACFLAAGAGVTGAAGWWRDGRGLVRSLGVAYLTGVAAYGVLAQLLFVLGLPMTRSQVVVLCGLLGSLSVAALRGDRTERTERRAHLRSRWMLAAIPLVAVLLLLAVDLWFQPLWAYDSWTFWTPKAHALYALNGLDAGWFTTPDLASKDYPLLLPAVEAAGFRFTGYETSLLDLQSWLFFVAFLLAIFEVGRDRAQPAVLWAVLLMLAIAPSVIDQLAAAEADIPVAILFATAGMCAWTWLVERRRGALPVAVVLASGAAATKVEGLIFVVSLFGALALALIPRSRRLVATAVLAGITASVLGVLPWRIWMAVHGVSNQASFGRISNSSFLLGHLQRIPEVAGYLAFKIIDPRAWIVLVPLALVVTAVAARGLDRVERRFAVGVVAVAFLGLVYAYWSTPLDLHYQLTTSARRTVTGIVFLCAALAPLLARDPVHAVRAAAPRPGPSG